MPPVPQAKTRTPHQQKQHHSSTGRSAGGADKAGKAGKDVKDGKAGKGEKASKAGKGKRVASKTSMYRGVTKTSGASWGAKYASKRICSTCATEEEAARMYDAHLKEVNAKKYKAYANFCPDCGLFRNTQRLVNVVRYGSDREYGCVVCV